MDGPTDHGQSFWVSVFQLKLRMILTRMWLSQQALHACFGGMLTSRSVDIVLWPLKLWKIWPLARLIKRQRLNLRYLLGLDAVDLRMYFDLASLWEGWTKTGCWGWTVIRSKRLVLPRWWC